MKVKTRLEDLKPIEPSNKGERMGRLIDPSRVEQVHNLALEHGVKASYGHLGRITKEAATDAGLPFGISAGDAVGKLMEHHREVLVGQLMKYRADPEGYLRALDSEEHKERFMARLDAHIRAEETGATKDARA